MLFLCFVFSILKSGKNSATTDLMEGTSWDGNNWLKYDSSSLNGKKYCLDETLSGPFLDSQTNFKGQFNDLDPHYKLQLSLDLMFTQYWSGILNFIKIEVDSSLIYTDSLINSGQFTTPSTYCTQNQYFGFLFNQQLTTIQQTIVHTSTQLTIYISSSFQCSLLSLFTFCEEIMIKNLILRPFACHFTCLSCIGPYINDCNSCPYGIPTNGQCQCQNGYVSFQHSCLTQCPQYFSPNLQSQCILDCSLNCLQCEQNMCINCINGYFSHLGQCVQICPENSIQIGDNCQDYSEQSLYGSEYIGKHFFSLDTDIEQETNQFQFSQTLGLSQLTGQLYSVYNNQYFLGGFGVWSEGVFKIIYNSLPVHNKIRIYLNLWIIDNWNNNKFTLKLDDQVVYQHTYTSSLFSSNLFYRNNKDFIDKLNFNIDHIGNSATLTFQSDLSVSSFEASLALNNIFILIDYCDNNCQICSVTQCAQCNFPFQLIKNKCGLCDITTFRLTDCSCLDGYFDDGTNQSCQKCRAECETCVDYSTCLICKLESHLQILPNCQNCENGYYYQGGSCYECDSSCLTCFNNNNSSCLSCGPSQILNGFNSCQYCLQNQYFINNSCVDCNYNCQTCQNLEGCLTCVNDRINVPICECQQGYFENTSLVCEKCNSTCSNCFQSNNNCTSCAANRDISKNCQCPSNSLENQDSLWCTDCDTAVLNIYFNLDLKKLIIDFKQSLDSTSATQCSQIFENSTLIELGVNPTCILEDVYISVILGLNPLIQFGTTLQFNQYQIKFQQCPNYLQNFINAFIQRPEIQPTPQITLSSQKITVSICQDTPSFIYILSQSNIGNNELQYIDWKLIKQSQQDNQIQTFLLNLNSQLNSSNISVFTIPQNVLQSNTQLILELNYQNYLQTPGSVLVTILQSTQQGILNLQSQIAPYYNTQPLILLLKLVQCDQFATNNVQTNYNTSISYQNVNYQIQLQLDQAFIFQIEQNASSQPGTFKLIARAFSSDDSVFATNEVILQIVPETPQLILTTGSSYIGYKQQLTVQSEISTLKNQNISVQWECFDIQLQQSCQQNGDQLILQTSYSIELPPYTFEPYKIILISAIYGDLKESLSVYIVETDVPKIEVSTYPDVSTGYINFYDQLFFEFTYSEIIINPDLLMYSCILTNSNGVSKQIKFDYMELLLQLQSHFALSELTDQITMKVNIYNPDYFMPSSISLKLLINLPPRQCLINITPQTGESIFTEFNINIINCYDENTPLQYRLLYYRNSTEFDYDNTKGNVQKGIEIQKYQFNQNFITKLTGNGQIYLMIQVKDCLNGISNYSTTLNISKNDSNITQKINDSESIQDAIIFALNLQFQAEIYIEQDTNQLLQKLIYYQNCSCNELLILKSLVASYQNYTPIEINQELVTFQNRLIDINSQFNLLNDKEIDKYEHTIQEYSKLQLFEETVRISNFISQLFIFSNNENLQNKQRRLLEETQSLNNKLILSNIQTISEIQLKLQVVNSPELIMQTNSYNITTKKATALSIQNYIGNSLTQPQTLNQQRVNNNSQLGEVTFQYKMISFRQNPYLFDESFQSLNKLNSNYPLYQIEILNISNQSEIQNLSQPIRYNFENNDGTIVQCVTKIQDTWDVSACQTIQQNDTTVCECQNVSPVTIIDAFETIISKTVNFFAWETVSNIANYQYTTVIFTYIIILDTILLIWFLYYGHRMDQREKEEIQYHSAKVTPVDWDAICEKPQGDIQQIATIDQEYRVTSTRKLIDRKKTQQKTIFSTDSQRTISFDKSFKKAENDINSRAPNSQRRNLATHQIYSIKKIDETAVENSPKSKQSSPKFQIEPSPPRENSEVNKKEALHVQVGSKKISIFKGYQQFVELNHKILSLYFLYDEDYSRIYRTLSLYISILGQISILTFFGTIINLNTIIALSLIQTFFGLVFRKLLSIFLHTEKLCLNYIGFNLAFLSIIFFLFIILGSITRYQSIIEATQWGAAYLTSFCLEQFVYSNLNSFILYVIVIKFGNASRTYVIIYLTLQQLLKYLMNEKVLKKIFP